MEQFWNLEYRGEGNCAIVLANTKTNQVYRLVKCKATHKLWKRSQANNATVASKAHSIQGVVREELENVINYMNNIIKPLLSSHYVVIPSIAKLPKSFGETSVAYVNNSRPGHRKKSDCDEVDPDVQFALVLPDFCFVYHHVNQQSSKLEDSLTLSAPEANPSNKDALCDLYGSVSSCQDFQKCGMDSERTLKCSPGSENSENIFMDMEDSRGQDVNVYSEECFTSQAQDGNDSELKDVSIALTSHDSGVFDENGTYLQDSRSSHIFQNGGCEPLDSNHKLPLSTHIIDRQSSLIEDCIFSRPIVNTSDDLSPFTLSIEIKPKKAFMLAKGSGEAMDSIEQVCRFCMHQSLKRKSGQWPQTSSYCPLDLFSGNRQRMKHALFSLIKTPQNNLKICKNGTEVYGSELHGDLSNILQDWFPEHPSRREKLVSLFVELVIEILLTPQSRSEADSDIPQPTRRPPALQKCQSSSFVHLSDEPGQRKLPVGCVLERIYRIQTLDDLGIEGVFPLYKKLKSKMEDNPQLRETWCFNGPFNDLTWLFGPKGKQLNDLSPESDAYAVMKVKRFLLSKTLQDCSIIVAIKPVLNSSASKNDKSYLHFDGDVYDYSVSVVDLDPKPFEKVKTYFRQATEIASAFTEESSNGSVF